MLIKFSVSNFLSFNDEIEFSMIPGRSRIHPNHIIRDERWNGINRLKASIVYGANASGKSNFCKAISFAKNFIVGGRNSDEKIHTNSFKLEKHIDDFSVFKFEFSIKSDYFAYGFKINEEKILEEWLYKITKNQENLLYRRITNKDNETKVEFGNIDLDNEQRDFAKFLAKATRENQLFLTEMNERKFKVFDHIFLWFRDKLTIIFPESRYMNLLQQIEEKNNFSESFKEILQVFDLGINKIEMKEVPKYEFFKYIPEEIYNDIKLELEKEKSKEIVLKNYTDDLYLLSFDELSDLSIKKLVTFHKSIDNNEDIPFELKEESDGTQRLFDLIPALINILNNEVVLIIDELDRSMHPLLTKKFLELFLKSKNTQSQIIVTTHESCLMNLDLVRRDEIWFIEKDMNFSSQMYSLEEYTPRYDKDIEKSYLFGRYGAIPILGNVDDLGW